MLVQLFGVNYNSYGELENFLSSIDHSLSKIESKESKDFKLEVIIGDASSNPQDISYTPKLFNLTIYKFDNKGYFGGIQEIMRLYSRSELTLADYTIISNVDLTVNEDFFYRLQRLPTDANNGWIAPQIFSKSENRDKNPKIISRPSLKRLKMLRLMYRFPVLHWLYENTLYKRKKLRPKYEEMDIYAGHGAFIILTKEFFDKGGKINYPIFLFGEEQYLAEELKLLGLKVKYNPSLIILDEEHVSTGSMKKQSYYNYNYQAMDYILKKYYL